MRPKACVCDAHGRLNSEHQYFPLGQSVVGDSQSYLLYFSTSTFLPDE